MVEDMLDNVNDFFKPLFLHFATCVLQSEKNANASSHPLTLH